METDPANLLVILLAVMGISVVVALVGLLLLVRSIRRLRIPPDADYFTTMRYVPLALVVLLDLLDFGLDIFAAPLSWVLLDRMGLYGLRNKAAIEAFIPFTQPIPTFTLSWFVARWFGLGDLRPADGRGSFYRGNFGSDRRRGEPHIIDMDDPRY